MPKRSKFFEYLTYSDKQTIKQKAERLLSQYLDIPGATITPVNLELLAKVIYDIEISYELLDKKTEGFFDPDVYIIRINEIYPFIKQRYTLAHEIAHLVLHYPFQQGIEQEIIMMKSNKKLYSAIKKKQEREAEYFASCLLLPGCEVEEQWELLGGPKEPIVFYEHEKRTVKKYFQVAYIAPTEEAKKRYSFYIKLRDKIATIFQTSLDATNIKLQQLGLVSFPSEDFEKLLKRRRNKDDSTTGEFRGE